MQQEEPQPTPTLTEQTLPDTTQQLSPGHVQENPRFCKVGRQQQHRWRRRGKCAYCVNVLLGLVCSFFGAVCFCIISSMCRRQHTNPMRTVYCVDVPGASCACRPQFFLPERADNYRRTALLRQTILWLNVLLYHCAGWRLAACGCRRIPTPRPTLLARMLPEVHISSANLNCNCFMCGDFVRWVDRLACVVFEFAWGHCIAATKPEENNP